MHRAVRIAHHVAHPLHINQPPPTPAHLSGSNLGASLCRCVNRGQKAAKDTPAIARRAALLARRAALRRQGRVTVRLPDVAHVRVRLPTGTALGSGRQSLLALHALPALDALALLTLLARALCARPEGLSGLGKVVASMLPDGNKQHRRTIQTSRSTTPYVQHAAAPTHSPKQPHRAAVSAPQTASQPTRPRCACRTHKKAWWQEASHPRGSGPPFCSAKTSGGAPGSCP